MGSAALGSFVVALIQFVRFLLEYLDKKSKVAQAKAGVAGSFVKYCMCCINCCMWYLEKVIKFINRYTALAKPRCSIVVAFCIKPRQTVHCLH